MNVHAIYWLSLFKMVKNPVGCFCPILLSPSIHRQLQHLQLQKLLRTKMMTRKGIDWPCRGTR